MAPFPHLQDYALLREACLGEGKISKIPLDTTHPIGYNTHMNKPVTITLTNEQAHLMLDYLSDLRFDGEAQVYNEDVPALITIVDTLFNAIEETENA